MRLLFFAVIIILISGCMAKTQIDSLVKSGYVRVEEYSKSYSTRPCGEIMDRFYLNGSEVYVATKDNRCYVLHGDRISEPYNLITGPYILEGKVFFYGLMNGTINDSGNYGPWKQVVVWDFDVYGIEYGFAGYPLFAAQVINGKLAYGMTYGDGWPTRWPGSMFVVWGDRVYTVWDEAAGSYGPCYVMCKSGHCEYPGIRALNDTLSFTAVRDGKCVLVMIDEGRERIVDGVSPYFSE